MTEQHPMTPPTELLTRWENDWLNEREHADVLLVNAYAAGAQAGADQELEACCELLRQKGVPAWSLLRLHRRPKPPSLKDEALEWLTTAEPILKMQGIDPDNTIRRALEALPND